MTLRIVLLACTTSVFGLLLTLAAGVWESPTALVQRATNWAAENAVRGFMSEATNQPIVQTGNCDDDSVFFATCEAPVSPAPPLEVSAPPVAQSAILANNSKARDTDLASRCCFGLIDACGNNDLRDGLTPDATTCCGKVENQEPKAAGGTSTASGCTCDPRECKCA